MNLIKKKLIQLKNILIEYGRNYRNNKTAITEFLNSDLTDNYIEQCNNMLLNGNFIDKPLNENELKLYVLCHKSYLFSDKEKITIIDMLSKKALKRRKKLLTQKP